jgi:hypothetical protein
MASMPTSVDAQGYLESLMRAGQDAMKQFDDALVSAAGVGTAFADSFKTWRCEGASRSKSSRLPSRSDEIRLTPVVLPSGRARDDIRNHVF